MLKEGEEFFSSSLLGLRGETILLSSLQGKIVVIEVGSNSCPNYLMNLIPMHELQKIYSEVVFATLAVEEMYPGLRSPLHHTVEDKMAMAKRMRKHDRRLFLIDDLSATYHTKLSHQSNALLILDKEGLVFYVDNETIPARIFRILQEMEKGITKINKRKLALILPLYKQGLIRNTIYQFKRLLLIFMHSDFKSLLKAIGKN